MRKSAKNGKIQNGLVWGTDWAHLDLLGPGGLTPPFVTPLLAASGPTTVDGGNLAPPQVPTVLGITIVQGP